MSELCSRASRKDFVAEVEETLDRCSEALATTHLVLVVCATFVDGGISFVPALHVHLPDGTPAASTVELAEALVEISGNAARAMVLTLTPQGTIQ